MIVKPRGPVDEIPVIGGGGALHFFVPDDLPLAVGEELPTFLGLKLVTGSDFVIFRVVGLNPFPVFALSPLPSLFLVSPFRPLP